MAKPTHPNSAHFLLQRDAEALSDGELLTLVMGSRGPAAIDIARSMAVRFGGLAGLARASMRELTAFPNVGLKRAARIHASFTLGRRLVQAVFERPGPYRGARDVFERIRPKVAGLEKEVFYVLLLNSKNHLIRDELVSMGTLTASLVHPREVFRAAIRESAAAIICAHSHPSGDPTPSQEDIAVTSRLRSAGELIGIPMLDHVIIGAGRYVSLAERGKLRGGR